MKLPTSAVLEYSNAVARYGPDSAQATRVREKYSRIDGFLKFAGALDTVKRTVGGCGIEFQPAPAARPAAEEVRPARAAAVAVTAAAVR